MKKIILILILLILISPVFAQEQAAQEIAECEVLLGEIPGEFLDDFEDIFFQAKDYFTRGNYSLCLAELKKIKRGHYLFNLALQDMEKMEQDEIGTLRFNDIFLSANETLYERNYTEMVEITDNFFDLKNSAYRTKNLTEEIDKKVFSLEEQDIDTSEANGLLAKCNSAFNREVFEDSESLAEQTLLKLEEIETRAMMERAAERGPEIKEILIAYFPHIAIAVIILIVISHIGYLKLEIEKVSKKLVNLKLEKDNINRLMKISQRKYYELKLLDEKQYKISDGRYRERLAEIKRTKKTLRKYLGELRKRKIAKIFKM